MPKAKDVKNIVIHCTAGFGSVASIKKFWKEVLGWKSPGYKVIIDLDGTSHHLAEYSDFTNGVQGHNHNSIHIAYIGGVEKAGTDKKGQIIWRGKDTRTPEQKLAIHREIAKALDWLKANGKDITKDLLVCGHYDFSLDKNGDGIIASWERIKECPSFDAMREYSFYTSKDRVNKLPTVLITPTKEDFIIYSVLPGDTLFKIAKKYSTTVDAIKAKNNLTTTILQPKQKLKV